MNGPPYWTLDGLFAIVPAASGWGWNSAPSCWGCRLRPPWPLCRITWACWATPPGTRRTTPGTGRSLQMVKGDGGEINADRNHKECEMRWPNVTTVFKHWEDLHQVDKWKQIEIGQHKISFFLFLSFLPIYYFTQKKKEEQNLLYMYSCVCCLIIVLLFTLHYFLWFFFILLFFLKLLEMKL